MGDTHEIKVNMSVNNSGQLLAELGTLTAPVKSAVFIEALDLTEAQIDAENRTVRQRIITAGQSANRRMYGEDVLKNAAQLFEGTKTYANHPSKSDQKDRPERSVRELTGWIDNVIYENGAIYGTRHFTRTQAGNDTWALVEDIVNGKAPASLMGASINALGKGRTEKRESGDVLIVESIDRVVSVDDVTVPAAGGGFERLLASDDTDLAAELLKLASFEEWQESQPTYVERLKKEWKTVRLEEATKQALTEADDNVKAARAEAGEARQALVEAQTANTTLTEANAKLADDIGLLRRKLAIEEALRGTGLPATYANDLREELPKLDPSEWVAKIEKEKSKAKRAGASARVPVTGAGQQEAKVDAVVISESQDPLPLPNEDIRTWQERTERINKNKR